MRRLLIEKEIPWSYGMVEVEVEVEVEANDDMVSVVPLGKTFFFFPRSSIAPLEGMQGNYEASCRRDGLVAYPYSLYRSLSRSTGANPFFLRHFWTKISASTRCHQRPGTCRWCAGGVIFLASGLQMHSRWVMGGQSAALARAFRMKGSTPRSRGFRMGRSQ